MASTIGIKLANGEFYSIVEENSPVKKRLVLTTVHDKQQSVQIDLYKSYTRTMADALYIGTLVVEKISPRPKGEPSIELIIASSETGEIVADAMDLDQSVKGQHHTLNVSLKSLEDDNREYDIPDFELEQNESPPSGLVQIEEKQRFPWLVVICGALILVAILLVIWLVFYRGNNSTGAAQSNQAQSATQNTTPAAPPAVTPAPVTAPAPVAEPEPEAPAQQAAEPAPVADAQAPVAEETPPPAVAETPPVQAETSLPPVIKAPENAPVTVTPALRTRPVPPVASYKVPSVIPKNGVAYKIRWGDTLWDIAGAFYRNPWLYHRIARFNNIRNPDLIISGRTIRVPPRN